MNFGIQQGQTFTKKRPSLPFKKHETDLITGGMEEWKTQVKAWVDGGMKCE